MKIFQQNNSGFTLLEIMVVITILGILATIVVVSLQEAREKAMISRSQVELIQIFNAFTMFEDDTGQWPGHKVPFEVELTVGNEICADGCAFALSDCEAGIMCNDVGNPYPDWKGPYMTPVPIDSWGNEYFFDTDYDLNGEWTAVIGSYGPDGIGNDLYNSDDITFLLTKQ